ncbi:MAG: hypothetical protein Q9218_007573, partial [Villophora microphyllina]
EQAALMADPPCTQQYSSRMVAKNLLITGATGKQGKALINTLLSSPQAKDFTILALTRNKASTSANALASKSPSIKLIQGNLDDPHPVFASALEATKGAPIWGVYSVQQAVQDGATEENETKQGKALVDLAVDHGVKHFVYSSVDRGGAKSGDNPTYVPHFRSKHNIEKHLLSKSEDGQKMSYTIIRPVAFMDGLIPGFMGKVFATMFKISLKPSKPLQYVAVSDIGFFAAQGFLEPEDPAFKNQAINLAGDELTFEQLNGVFEKKMGYPLPVTYEFLARFVKWMLKEVNVMLRWFDEEGYGADIPALRKMHPGLKGFGEWLETESNFVKK